MHKKSVICPCMSAQVTVTRKTTQDIRNRKGAEPIVVLTAYTAPMAALLDEHTDILLVGDSLGMVLYGMESTLPVTVEMMVQHGRAVMRGSQSSLVVIDMPFGSYQESPERAFRNASHILAETGAQAVKLEGGSEMAETVRFLTQRGVPVMGHVGLTPQHVQQFGGFRVQGRDDKAAQKIMSDAAAISDAGAFSMVIEGVVESLASEMTQHMAVPTIGIGASAACDGQVLVSEDMLGLNAWTPKFVKRYADMASLIREAAKAYADEVRNRTFPDSNNTYS